MVLETIQATQVHGNNIGCDTFQLKNWQEKTTSEALPGIERKKAVYLLTR